jgi:hypothetical protein
MGTGDSFPGDNARPGRDANHSPQSSAEVKNEQELHLLSPLAPLQVCCENCFTSVYMGPCVLSADPGGHAVFDSLVPGIAGSNPADGMDVCLLCLYVVLYCVGRGLCDGLINRPQESNRVSNSV